MEKRFHSLDASFFHVNELIFEKLAIKREKFLLTFWSPVTCLSQIVVNATLLELTPNEILPLFALCQYDVNDCRKLQILQDECE